MANILIHGKSYTPVVDRLRMAHEDEDDRLQSVITEAVHVFEDGGVVFRAVVTFASGRTFTGHAYESPKSQGVAGKSPWETCETSAVGRALGVGGYGSDDSVASADEVQRKTQGQQAAPRQPQPAPAKPAPPAAALSNIPTNWLDFTSWVNADPRLPDASLLLDNEWHARGAVAAELNKEFANEPKFKVIDADAVRKLPFPKTPEGVMRNRDRAVSHQLAKLQPAAPSTVPDYEGEGEAVTEEAF
jgi:hypothetical protein